MKKDFCLLKTAYRGMEQFSRWAKLRSWLWSVVLFLVEKKKLLPYLALRHELMLMGKDILSFKEHQAQEHIACWGGGNTSDCSHLENRLEKCWCFRCSEWFPEQFDRVTSWEVFQPGASGFASFIFKQPWRLKPVLRNKCWKEDSPMASL